MESRSRGHSHSHSHSLDRRNRNSDGVACVTGTVARVTGIDVDGNALGGCLERHERALTDLRSGPGFNGEAESSCLAAEGVS